jgi:dihydrofolate reductase
MKLSLIAAVARNGAIGKDNALLWHLPGDLPRFKQLTMGSPLIMGRKTYDSIGRPLPGRRNIVISRNPDWSVPGVEIAHSLDEALALVAEVPQAFVMGGGQIYAQALPHADELVLTEVDQDVLDADTFFPEWPRADFEETAREVRQVSEPAPLTFAYVNYRRRPY